MRELASPGSVYFEERGTGLPIVTLHGWPGKHDQTMAMMEPLCVHRRGLASDQRASARDGSQFRTSWVGQPRSDARRSVGLHRHPRRGPNSRTRRALLRRDACPRADGCWYQPSRCGLLLSPDGFGVVPEEAGPPTVFAESQQFQDELTEAEKKVAGLFRVRTMQVLDIVRRQAMPGVHAADCHFLDRVAAGPDFTYLSEPGRPFPVRS